MPVNDSFLSSCTSGGCGAKIGPGELSGILGSLPTFSDPRLMVGFDALDDAAVYRLNDETALISTTDFFSPMVNDPHLFGRIAAANALSDVWAMGGRPVLALSLVCFPKKMDMALLGAVLAGGAEKIAEAGAVLGGGHSIYDKEPKYGLAVTGLVHPQRVLRNNTPRVGDALILTKPLGVGIVLAAARAGLASDDAYQSATDSMQRLNRYAAEKMAGFSVSACTDITGFGLLGHLLEMLGKSACARIFSDRIPFLPHAAEYADEYLLTAAGQRNRTHVADKWGDLTAALPFAMQELLYDPQTSGGLLIAVDARASSELLRCIQEEDPQAAIIGAVVTQQSAPVVFEATL